MTRPKVAFIGTGGTIASLGVSPLELQDYGASGTVMHAEEIVARFPETALVAEVLPVRYRNVPARISASPTGRRWSGCATSLWLNTPTWSGLLSATALRRWRKPPTRSA